MKADRYLDSDADFIVPKPFFIVGKHALDEPVRSNPPSSRSHFWSDFAIAAITVGLLVWWSLGGLQ